MSALHSLTAELHAGFLTLAIACIILVALSQIVIRLRHRSPERITAWAAKVRVHAESAGYVGAILGLIALILSAVTGMLAWPADALLESGLVRNKIMITVFGTLLWGVVVYMRTSMGRGLWMSPTMASLYTGFAIVAFGMTGVAGSLGAHLTIGESVLDPIWALLGLDFGASMELRFEIALVITVGSAWVLAALFVLADRRNMRSSRIGPCECPNFVRCDGGSRLDEPDQQ